MKKFLLFLFFFSLGYTGFAQKTLHIIYDPSAPRVTKDVRKYKMLRGITEPRIGHFGMVKSPEFYIVGYPFFASEPLLLRRTRGASVTTVQLSDVPTLYPHARTPAQLDADLQPAIEYDYEYGAEDPDDLATVKYFDQFTKIYVIDYIGNGLAQVVEVYIGNEFE